MTDAGPVVYYLSIEIVRDRPRRTIYLSQADYIKKVLQDFQMWETTEVRTPMDIASLDRAEERYQASENFRKWYQSAVGLLMYTMMGTRPDLAFAVSVISRYASNPDSSHEKAVKKIFRYLRGSIDFVLIYRRDMMPLNGFTDADWAGDKDTRRSTLDFTFNISSGALS